MNWEEIRKKNPKAVNKMENWLNETKHHFVKKGQERLLYDFFDENDIFVEISIDKVDGWFYDIFGCYNDGNTFTIAENSKYLTRPKAETAAFEKAFEILENK